MARQGSNPCRLSLTPLQALEARAIWLDDGVIDVQHGWDRVEGRILTKGRNRRRAPIPSALHKLLVGELLRAGRRGDQLVFGADVGVPFPAQGLQYRADAAWKKAKIDRITPHELRHTCASLMIAAGGNAKALSTYMGHSTIQITYDRYGHLMPGNEEQAAGLLDDYLDAAKATG